MANNTAVIQEFLVSLGFVIDESAQKKFTGGLGDTEKGVLKVGGAFLTAVTALATFTEQMAKGLEQMFYTSQLSGIAAEDVQALKVAFAQIGVEGKEVEQVLGRFGAAMADLSKQRPLQNFSGVGKDVKGLELLLALMKRLHAEQFQPEQPGWKTAVSMAGQAGLSETDLRLIDKNYEKFIAALQAQIGHQGKGLTESTKAAVDLENTWARVGNQMAILSQILIKDLIPPMKKIADFIERTLGRLVKQTTTRGVAEESIRMIGDAVPALKAELDFVDWLHNAMGTGINRTRPMTMEDVHKLPGTVSAQGGGAAGGGAAGDKFNNPFDLKSPQPKQIGTSNGFAMFNSIDDAFDAFSHQISLYRTGNSRNAPGQKLDTEEKLASLYTKGDSPSIQAAWIASVEKASGIKRNQRLGAGDMAALARGVGTAEGSHIINSNNTTLNLEIRPQDNGPAIANAAAGALKARTLPDTQRYNQTQQRNVNPITPTPNPAPVTAAL